MRERIHQILHRVDRLAVAPDEQRDIRSGTRDRDALVALAHIDMRLYAERTEGAHHETARIRGLLALLERERLRSLFRKMRDHARRLVPDAEQPALALGHDLEPDGRLVERGVAQLELPQRRPLRLADRLSRRLDRRLRRACAVAHRRPAFFFLRTLRGCCGTTG